MIENDISSLYTSSSINNYFSHKIQSKFLSKKKNIIQACQKKDFFLFDLFFINGDFFSRQKGLFHLMTYFCYVKYVTTALIKEGG